MIRTLVFLITITFSSVTYGSDIESFKKFVIQTFTTVEQKYLTKEPVKPVVEPAKKCPCNGTGFIKQGDGHVTECPRGDNCDYAKKKAKPKTAMAPKKHAVIEMATSKSCPSCLKWKRELAPIFQKNGWTVEYINDDNFLEHSTLPAFTIYLDGKKYNYVGYLDQKKVIKIVEEHKNGNSSRSK